jgi:hypothetical protein
MCSGDAVGAWFGDKLAAVLFPTADTRKQLQQLAERSPNPPDLIIIANPQWELEVGAMVDSLSLAYLLVYVTVSFR